MTRKHPSWVKIALLLLVVEKIIQHTLVTLALYNDWKDIRSTVAVNPNVLVVLGAIVSILFILGLWALLSGHEWVTSLLIGLAAFDIIGEFVAQGMIAITITVSFIVAIALLILSLIYRRELSRASLEKVSDAPAR